MNKEEAKQLVRKAHFNIDDPNREGVIAVDKIYDDFEKQQLENIAHLQMANEIIDKLKKKCEWLEKDRCFLEKESELKVKIENIEKEKAEINKRLQEAKDAK